MLESARNATPTSAIAGETAVSLRGAWKTYHQKQRSERLGEALRHMFRPVSRPVEALRGVDLTIRRGEIVAYAGPNGAGKSTTIKLLAGLLAPDAGEVRALGFDPSRERARYVARVGVVFGQRTELWWDHPIAASYEWKRVVWDVPRERFERMLGFAREALGVGDYYQSLARELSLGQRMRADLGLARLHEPDLLLLDEPTLGLDVLAKRQILAFLRELNRERGTTVLVTSHDMSDLEQLASRIVFLHRGSIAFDGGFDDLRREVGDRRRLVVETSELAAPALPGAGHEASDGARHTYVYDAARTRVVDLLDAAAAQTTVLDVETQRLPIDDVVADVYERWLRGGGVAPGG